MNTYTIRLHRVLKAKPELVDKAFLDPDALARWLPPNGLPGGQESLRHLAGLVEGRPPAEICPP